MRTTLTDSEKDTSIKPNILEIDKKVKKVYAVITLNFIIADSERFKVCQTSFILLTREVEAEV